MDTILYCNLKNICMCFILFSYIFCLNRIYIKTSEIDINTDQHYRCWMKHADFSIYKAKILSHHLIKHIPHAPHLVQLPNIT